MPRNRRCDVGNTKELRSVKEGTTLREERNDTQGKEGQHLK
jgi:hypothetical protein